MSSPLSKIKIHSPSFILIRSSSTMGCRRSFCICFTICFIIIAASIAIPITLSIVGVKPRFYVQDFYIPAFNNSTKFNSSNLNTSIFIHIKFKRVLTAVPIRYEDTNITLFYASNTSSSVGYGVIPRFGQGEKKTVHRRAVVEARGLPWEDAVRNISSGSTVEMAVEMATKYSKKSCNAYYVGGTVGCYYSKPKAVTAAAEVLLDGSGHQVSKKPIRLH